MSIRDAVVYSTLLGFFGAHAISPVWPQPSSVSLGDKSLSLDSNFYFKKTSSALVNRAITRYSELIDVATVESTSEFKMCELTIDDFNEDNLDLNVDESYTLSISESGYCKLASSTVWGSLHALETFSQLLVRKDSSIVCDYLPVTISDSARFTHRGLMIDSSRHYLPTATIYKMIDTLPASKFNVLHWHIVDAQSFPLNSPSAPDAVKGSYASTATYSIDDLKSVDVYAKDRGVRVVYEIDIPGHAASWAMGYPEIMADCMVKYSYNINDFALNPTLDDTYTVVHSILEDIQTATGAKYLHIGGDEVVYGCWANDTSITDWMAENNMTDYDDLLGYFVHRADDYINDSLGATPIHWEEVFSAGIVTRRNTLFQVWTSQTQILGIVQAGYRVIASPSDVWYLDHAENTWDVMYQYDPTKNLSSREAKLIIGGEVAMWGEHIDENNIESIVYPRAASVGERLWSEESVTNVDTAKERLNIHRCRLIERGVRSSAIEPGYCTTKYV